MCFYVHAHTHTHTLWITAARILGTKISNILITGGGVWTYKNG